MISNSRKHSPDEDTPFITLGVRKLKHATGADWSAEPKRKKSKSPEKRSKPVNNASEPIEPLAVDDAHEHDDSTVANVHMIDPDEDFEEISAMINDFYTLWNTGELQMSTIDWYQETLDAITSQYSYDDSIGFLYAAFYELQAIIHAASEDYAKAARFLNEAFQVKPREEPFISIWAQTWYPELQEEQKAESNARYKAATGKKPLKKSTKIFLFGLATAIIALIVLWGPMSDYFTINSADPAMIKLSQEADMTHAGELLFLRSQPEFVSDNQMEQDCPSLAQQLNSDGRILQGCYKPNQSNPATGKIYLREMPSDLHDLEVTTAAYEMLHAAYYDISGGASNNKSLDQLIESGYSDSTDPNVTSAVNEFATAEPGARDLELFSLLGTDDYSSLDTSLGTYYLPYLEDPSVVEGMNNHIFSIFTDDEAQLTQLQKTIKTDDNYANTAYADSVSWARVGNQYEDDRNYNIYKQDLQDENAAVDQYNSLLQTYDQLVDEFNGQQFSPLQNVSS